MMAENIKLRGVFRPWRVNPASREDRQDEKERFRKKLAELREEAEENSRAQRRRSRPALVPHDDRQEPPAEPDADGKTGHHIDLRT